MAKVNATPVIEEQVGTRTVFVRAKGIVAFGNGLFGIEIPSRNLESDEYKMLDRLFPHTQHHIEEALSTEALLSSQEQPLSGFNDKPVNRLDVNGIENMARY